MLYKWNYLFLYSWLSKLEKDYYWTNFASQYMKVKLGLLRSYEGTAFTQHLFELYYLCEIKSLNILKIKAFLTAFLTFILSDTLETLE